MGGKGGDEVERPLFDGVALAVIRRGLAARPIATNPSPVMDPYGTAKLAAKEAQSAIVAHMCEDFNLTQFSPERTTSGWPATSLNYGHQPTRPGELCYLAVDAAEPGAPIVACRKVLERLERATREDQETLRTKDLASMRQGRLTRLTRQARVQSGLPTVDDIAYLTCLTLSEGRDSDSNRARSAIMSIPLGKTLSRRLHRLAEPGDLGDQLLVGAGFFARGGDARQNSQPYARCQLRMVDPAKQAHAAV